MAVKRSKMSSERSKVWKIVRSRCKQNQMHETDMKENGTEDAERMCVKGHESESGRHWKGYSKAKAHSPQKTCHRDTFQNKNKELYLLSLFWGFILDACLAVSGLPCLTTVWSIVASVLIRDEMDSSPTLYCF